MNKKKIVVLVDWYLPGYKAGGPIQSVANIISRLNEDFEFAVITSNSDLNEEPYSGIIYNEWTTAPDGTRTYYFSKDKLKLHALKTVLLREQADVIYLNSLFSLGFTLLPLYIRKAFLPSRKTVLAPRGMLGKGALAIKPFRKKAFLLFARLSGLFRNITWHASTELEAAEVKKHFGRSSRIITATNLSAKKDLRTAPRIKTSSAASFVFISRISSKKNLATVIRSMKNIPAGNKVSLDIYGPVEDNAYWQECLDAIKQCPAHVRISYKGPVENYRVSDMLKQYHFSVLYTLHENFGHSIIESMAGGCPVIISDQTPWRDLSSRKAGWDVPINDGEALLNAIKFCCSMNQQEYDEWSKGAATFASTVINDEEAVAANISLFN